MEIDIGLDHTVACKYTKREPPKAAPPTGTGTQTAAEMASQDLDRVDRTPLLLGFLIRDGPITVRELVERTGFGDPTLYTYMKNMESAGLVCRDVLPNGLKGASRFRVADGAVLPASREELIALADGFVRREHKPRASKDDDLVVFRVPRVKKKDDGECAMAKALARDAPIRAEDAPAYRELLDFLMGAPEGTGEIKAIMKELRQFLQYRVSNVKSMCPFCGGQVVNDSGAALCKGCKRRIFMGSFEDSLAGMQMLALQRRREQRWDCATAGSSPSKRMP